MSSIFEAPASRSTGSVLKIAAAFAAGIVVAAATMRVSAELPGPKPTASAPVQRAAPAEPARQVAKKPVDTPQPVAPAAAASAPETRETSIKPADASPCQQRAWPYTDQGCTEPDTNVGQATRPVRVISPDKAGSPTTAAGAPQDASAQQAAVAPVAPPVPKATAVAAAEAAVAAPPAAAGSAPPQPALPPAEAARESAPPAAANQAQAKAPTRTARDGAANGKRDAKRTKPGEPGEKSVRTARAPNSQARGETPQDRNEAEGFALVRSRVLPDGRRVTVYRKLRGEDDGAVASRERERARPSLFSPFGSRDDDDDD